MKFIKKYCKLLAFIYFTIFFCIYLWFKKHLQVYVENKGLYDFQPNLNAISENGSDYVYKIYGPLDPRTEHLVSLLSTDASWSKRCKISTYLQEIIKERRVWQTGLVFINEEPVLTGLVFTNGEPVLKGIVFTTGEPVLVKVYGIKITELQRREVILKEGIVTLATHLTQERTSLIPLIASQWEGPIVAVIEAHKIDISSELDKLVKNVKLLRNRMYSIQMLFVEKVSDLYPINWMRNLAQAHVKSEFIIHVDADFIPNKGLYKSLCDLSVNHVNWSDKKAIIIPAFDMYTKSNHSNAIPTIPDSKKDLLLLEKNNLVEQFHIDYMCGHGLTNYTKWRESKANYNIEVLKRSGKRRCYECYEPYFMVRTNQSAFFPETLLHRGFNKVPSFGQLCQKGFTFEVLHNGFLLHKEHTKSPKNTTRPFEQCAQRGFLSFVNYTRFHDSDQ